MTSKTLLIVAFETPPSNGASVQRILSVYEHFLSKGWSVDILTASSGSYERTLDSNYEFNPKTLLMRAPAIDVYRHLSIKGKHPGFLVRPDRWGLSWKLSARWMLRAYLRKKQPDVIWSSSPIPSVHEIGLFAKRNSGALWVADYRDPMPYLQGGKNKTLNELTEKIDFNVVRNANMLTFATDDMRDKYLSYYSGSNLEEKTYVIKNGFVEKRFKQNADTASYDKQLELYYAGVLYPNGRDPSGLFKAISEQKKQANVKMTFQGAGSGLEHENLISSLGIEESVQFLPSVDFDQAVSNMMSSRALVLIQGERFNSQIPGKLYEYLRTGKPILLIAPPNSATAKEACRFPGVFQCEGQVEISKAINLIAEGPKEFIRDVSEFSREYQARKLELLILNLLRENI